MVFPNKASRTLSISWPLKQASNAAGISPDRLGLEAFLIIMLKICFG